MRRLLLSLLGVVVSIASVNAGKLTAQQALQKAQQFLGGKSVVAVESNKTLTRSLGDAPAFYIFNAKDNEGFVIVSADDRTEAVLGYSFHGTFSLDDMPDNLRWWLSEYTKQIKSLTDDYRPSEKATTRTAKSAIAPLITTTWDQSTPYNLQCPEYEGQKCYTGCIATALAQVMYYFKWPSSCSSLPAYVTNKLKLSVPELPATTFKWDRMKTSYAYGENSGPAAEAVAELLRYCGQANEMDYTPSGSGAYIHEDVMINSFNYSKNMRYFFRDDFAQDHWESIIYNELAENRPVLYGGEADPGSVGEGHQFICDGYDGNGKYHMNWGWGGYCDGYYLLSACNPESQGVPMGGRYNTGQHANIGFKPAVEGEVIIPDLQSAIQDYSIQSFTRTSGKSDFENIPLYAWIFAVYKVSPESPFSSEVGWGLYQGENLIQTFSAGSVDFEAKNYAYARNELSVSFGKDLKDGKYQFRQIYKDQITQDWTLCSYYITNSLIVEIAGTSMTVRMIDNGKVKFSVGNLRCSDMPAVGMPVTVTADVTNLGEANYLTACLWSQKEGETTWHNESSQSVNVDQEKTAGIEFQFTPESAGNFNLKITSNVSEDALATAKIEVSAVENVTQDGISYICVQASKTATVIQGDYSELESVDIPAAISVDKVKYKVKAIGDNAFSSCWNLKTLTLAEGIESIGNSSFWNIGVSELSLPSTLKSIGDDAFAYIYIKSLVIPEGVESIGNYAFYGSGVENVELPSTLTNLGQCAFASTRTLVTVISRSVNPSTVDESTFTSSARWDSESAKTIYEPTEATLYIPVGSKSAYMKKGWSIFAKIEEGEPFETVIGGLKYLCSPGSKTAMVIPGDYSELESVKIPSSISVDKVKYKVKAIGNRAFGDCWNLKTLTLAEGIESIGNRSFQSIGVTELSLPSTLKSIGDDAFGYIYNIKSLVIPEGVESIGNYAFYGSGFEKVELPSTLTSIGGFVFAGCNYLTSVTSYSTDPQNVNTNAFVTEKYDQDLQQWIHEPLSAILNVPVGTKKKYKQADGWKEFKNIVEVGKAVSITISAAQQLAYYSDKALDFTLYPELKAYVATGYAKSGTIWLTRVKKVPAETGFLLMGDEGDYEIPVSESASDCYYKNLFKGTLEGATIPTTEDGYTNYYLSKGEYGVSFYKVGASGVKLGANRAYLSVPSDIPAVGTAGGTETIKVSAALQVPYYSANSLDFTDMESKGLKAYTATGYDYAKGTIWLSRVKQVPAETGILIMADKAGDYDVPKASVASVYENMFMGTLGGKTIQTEETIAGEDYINYYLSKGDYGISFYKVGASGVTLGENRCYLPIPVRESSASGTRSFSSEADQITIQEADEVIGIPLYRGIGGDEDGTTSVKEVKSGEVKVEEWFTLQGQRVAKPGKGLYIKNGKKILIK